MELLGVALFTLLAFGLVGALALLFVRREPTRRRIVLLLAAALDVLVIVTIVNAVSGEGYTDDGRSVWQVATTAVRAGILAAIVVALLAAGVTWLSTRRSALAVWVVPAAATAVVINYLSLVSTLE